MEVLEIIDMLEDVVEKSMAIPFAGRAVVDREELLDLIQEIRLNLPGDLKAAENFRRGEQRGRVHCEKCGRENGEYD